MTARRTEQDAWNHYTAYIAERLHELRGSRRNAFFQGDAVSRALFRAWLDARRKVRG